MIETKLDNYFSVVSMQPGAEETEPNPDFDRNLKAYAKLTALSNKNWMEGRGTATPVGMLENTFG